MPEVLQRTMSEKEMPWLASTYSPMVLDTMCLLVLCCALLCGISSDTLVARVGSAVVVVGGLGQPYEYCVLMGRVPWVLTTTTTAPCPPILPGMLSCCYGYMPCCLMPMHHAAGMSPWC